MNKAAKITELCNELVAERRACELEKNEALLKVDELSAEVERLKRESGMSTNSIAHIAIKKAIVDIMIANCDSDDAAVLIGSDKKYYISVKALHAYADELGKGEL